MERTERGFSYTVELPDNYRVDAQHPFLFKFVVDGVWQCGKHFPIAVDGDGIENNYLVFDDAD